MTDDLRTKLIALVADWRGRRYNYISDRASAEVFARGEGKEDAFCDAADDLEAILKEDIPVVQVDEGSITYNPLAAFGIRIGTPEQNDFLDSHEAIFTERFGAEFVQWMRQALAGDLPSAWSITTILARTTRFVVLTQTTTDTISVAYVCRREGIDGRITINAIPPLVTSQAMVLVAAAIQVYNASINATLSTLWQSESRPTRHFESDR